jgi:hypothetical protein
MRCNQYRINISFLKKGRLNNGMLLADFFAIGGGEIFFG